MNPFIVNRLCKLASVSLIGSVSRDCASVGLDGVEREESRDYSGIVRLMALMDGPKEANKKMKKIELSEDDSDFIAGLTGNRGQGVLLFDDNNNDLDDEDSLDSNFSFCDRISLSVVDKLRSNKFRNHSEMLTFAPRDMWGNFDEQSYEQQRKWLRDNIGTFGAYVEAVLGKRAGKSFLSKLKEHNQESDNHHKVVEDFLGKPKEVIEPTNRMPGKAWAQAHHILRSDLGTMTPDEHKLRWDAVDMAQGYTLETGRLEDEIDDQRMAKNGWVFDQEGKPKYIGFPISYLYKEGKPVMLNGMKVLNINVCVGTKPTLKFFNLVQMAYDDGATERQRLIRRKLINMYRQSMAERYEGIKTARNGHYSVYYLSYKVDGKEVTVFSPIPMRDLREDRVEEIQRKLAAKRQREEIAKDVTII